MHRLRRGPDMMSNKNDNAHTGLRLWKGTAHYNNLVFMTCDSEFVNA